MIAARTALALGSALLAATASAQVGGGAEPASVALRVPDCLGVSGEQVRSLVALELAPRLRVEPGAGPAEIVGTVVCDPERVKIEIDDPAQPAPLRLELDLAAAPVQARTRLLALSIAELIATARLERAPKPQPPAAAENAAPAGKPAASAASSTESTPESTAETAAKTAPWALWLAPGLSRMGEPGLTLLGVEAGASYAVGPLALLGQLQARWGAADALVAEVAVQTYSASVALAPRLTFGSLELALGPGVRLGYARLSGRPEPAELEGKALSGVWFGPCAVANVQLRVAPWAAVRAGFELGYVTQSVRGLDHESQRLLELDGLWTSASIGAGLLLH